MKASKAKIETKKKGFKSMVKHHRRDGQCKTKTENEKKEAGAKRGLRQKSSFKMLRNEVSPVGQEEQSQLNQLVRRD